MLKVIQHIFIIPLLISAILSLKVFRLRWPFQYKIFSVLLLFLLILECFNIIWKYYLHNAFGWHYSQATIWSYNISFAFQYLLYTLFYYHSLSHLKFRRAVLVTGILLCIFIILNQLFWQGLHQVNTYAHILADCCMIFFCFAFFEELKNSEIKNEKLKLLSGNMSIMKNPLVWISLGVFIYHLLNIPYLFGMNYMVKNKIPFAVNFHYIYMSFVCLMYICFIKSFLCPHPQQK